MDKVVRVDMTNKKVTVEKLPEKYKGMGGRWLTSMMVSDEVPAGCHPLGLNNKLIFAPGIVTGTHAPNSGRLSVGGKSPLTGGIKEANAGTPFAQKLARMGYAALILEGLVEDGKRWLLKLRVDGGELVPADDLKDKGTYECAKMLWTKFGEKTAFAVNGPAGEAKMVMAGIAFNDPEGRPARYAGRGGLGAVMGSKGLKAIVLDDAGAPGVTPVDPEAFRTGQKKLADAILAHDVTKKGGALNSYGTAVLVNILNEAGGFPTNNFRTGVFEGASKISGEAIAEAVQKRGGAGMMGHSCHPGCIIHCSNVYAREDGSEHVSCVEYESAWSLGANCGIDNLDQVAELVRICNDVGIDTIEAGVTVGVAMEAGLASFGDGTAAICLLQEIGKRTPLGHILGQGAQFTGEAYGVTRIPTVKRQGMPAYEPRAVKGIGVTYITSTMGADHTAGYTIAPEILAVGGKVEPLSSKDKVGLSKAFQQTTAFVDATGYCLFIAFPILDIPSGFEGMMETVNAMIGASYTGDDAVRIGGDILKLERAFNQRAGITSAQDRPPEFMRFEKLPPHNLVWDISDEELDSFWID
ncbi:MAG TPA: aldehyde ferredoxin oxidoreductase C-terminal domain-containing protein [Candidatus Limnocylindrales bacterium]|nr:aldehyde ferredoxin oxidoreductase C-terminal domain-containing protein [Candidatus Limnocylindrales bacterium]